MKQFSIYFNEEKGKLTLEELPYKRDGLSPVMSKDTIDYHYGQLAKGYVERYNKGEGDPEFNKAGAFLHNIYFPQLKPYTKGNIPTGKSAEFIDKHYKDGLKGLKKEFEDVAMKIQGSGWVYLASNGEVKTIFNHEIKNDIVLLIDWWEHAWALDYQSHKKNYLMHIWSIINWEVINEKL